MIRCDYLLLGLAAVASAVTLTAADFWDAKDAAQWSSKEVERMLTHSPWSKPASLDLAGANTSGSAAPTSTGRGRGDRGGSSSTVDRACSQMRTEWKVLVRWETARPIRDAVKKELPPEFGEVYLVSVTGLPLGGERGQKLVPQLKDAARLERKGQDPIAPIEVQTRDSASGIVAYFIFPRGARPIAETDQEVVLHIKANPIEVKAKFALKDMLYKGKLTL